MKAFFEDLDAEEEEGPQDDDDDLDDADDAPGSEEEELRREQPQPQPASDEGFEDFATEVEEDSRARIMKSAEAAAAEKAATAGNLCPGRSRVICPPGSPE